MVKKISTKKIGHFIYKLVYFEGDDKYVIYKDDSRISEIHEIPEVAEFNNKADAEKFLDKIV